MLSVSGKYWEEINVSKRIVDKVKNDNNFSEIISKIIVSKKFDKEELNSINYDLEVSNPFLDNKDFKKGHSLLKESLKNKDKIVIVGDYDVDGCVSTSLIVNYFRLINRNIDYYIPNRFLDGYGASLELIKKLTLKNPNLIIMVDCGSNSNETIDYLNKKKIKSIIIDHHEINRPYPNADCLINPKKNCNYNALSYFCSSTLVYYFISSFLNNKDLINTYDKNLINVVLASICDVMPLRRLNRIIAKNVINNFQDQDNYIYKKILNLKKINRPIEINDFGFLIGPIINSAGRLGDANKVVKLLTTQNDNVKNQIIEQIIRTNDKRKKIEENFFKEININKIKNSNGEIIIISRELTNEGIIGIIASRLKEYFNKPSVVLTKSGNFYKASARSTLDFNIGKYIKSAIDKKIIISGGGHNLAAGFVIKKNKIREFEYFINDLYKKHIIKSKKNYISKISAGAINFDFFKDINKLGPFGTENSNPVFLLENVNIIKPKIIKDKFVNFFIKSSSGKLIPAISFNFLESPLNKILLSDKNKMSLIVQIKENIWNNKKNLQLIVLDCIRNLNKA
mgnify:CR=1 FL=1